MCVTRGILSYADTEHWPPRLFDEGIVLNTRVRLFGWGPFLPHEVTVVRVHDAEGKIETKESGGLIQIWNHQMRIQSFSDTECHYTDRIEMHAGLATPVVWLFAAIFYRYRQRRWRLWLWLWLLDSTVSDESDNYQHR